MVYKMCKYSEAALKRSQLQTDQNILKLWLFFPPQELFFFRNTAVNRLKSNFQKSVFVMTSFREDKPKNNTVQLGTSVISWHCFQEIECWWKIFRLPITLSCFQCIDADDQEAVGLQVQAEKVALPGQQPLCVSSWARSCPPGLPPCATASHSSPAARGSAAPPTGRKYIQETAQNISIHKMCSNVFFFA